MEIRIKALKFEASEKLLAFVEKKVARIEKFFDSATQVAEVSQETTWSSSAFPTLSKMP